ncbi:hypothetical protein ACHAP7_002853 [Fusarium lateritium]
MIMARGALISMIYSKLLRLKGNNSYGMTAFTLVTADVETIVNDSWRLLEPWAHLLQIVIGTYLLYRQLGAVCCVPIIVIFLTFTLVAVIGSQIPAHQGAWFKAVEKRINLTSHTLGFLQPVKLLGLSRIMEEKVHSKRQNELKISQKFRVNNCLALASAYAPQSLAPLITFGAYSIMKMVSHQPNFSVTTAVSSFSILNLVSTPAMQLLLAIPMGAQAIGCYGRIQSFLQISENLHTPAQESSADLTIHSIAQERVEGNPNISLQLLKQPLVEVTKDDGPKSLFSVQFTPNSIVAITGPSGCGKSTVLRNLLASEEAKVLGVFPSADIAYCSQTPWTFEGTVRENIIGQSELDNVWYQHVIQRCELNADLERMPKGDATEVGNRGSKLSGGQRQRIAIARALYSRQKRAIFDDIASALDGHTVSSITNSLFGENGIIRSTGMSVIVSTHSVRILQGADQVNLMNQDGQVIDSGTYDELVKRQEYFSQHQAISPITRPSGDSPVQVNELEISRGEYEARLQTKIDDLQRKKGNWRSFIYYLGAMGWFGLFYFVAGTALYVVLNAVFGVWLVWWAEDTYGDHGLGYWLGLYAMWAVLITLGVLATPVYFFTKLAYKASHAMHSDLLVATMRAPMSKLSDTEDTGTLVNRFSQDIRLCDWQLPFNILLTLMALLVCLASIGIAISAVPIEQKAPIVSLFLDTIQGLSTIHSFGWSPAYIQKGFSLLDQSQKPYYLLFCVQRWLILVLALIATGMEIVVIGVAIALRTQVSAGLVGLAIVHVTTLARSLSDLVMQWTEMETSLGAVSRIYRFTRETPREGLETPVPLPEEWPLSGNITFENVSATYDTSPGDSPNLALSNVTFTIETGSRVGICGRTGSGKSTLMATILRMVPCHQGQIFIDGTELSTIDPEDVRLRINYVTQEPFLFEGTMRENLTPWNDRVADDEMLEVLEKVNLLKKVNSLGGLDALYSEESFSHGEKQLFCLARSILKNSNILILDEPTGHIDPATDATIQKVIKREFPGRTIIMIAHRLEALVAFDTIIVLDAGRVREIGSPKSLLNDCTSAFNALYHAVERGEKRNENSAELSSPA